MPPAVTVTLLILLGALALWGMRVGWRHRAVRTADLVPTLPAVPADGDPRLGEATTAALDATYVSSTVAGDRLDRVVARGLGVRSRAVVQVFTAGVRVRREGAEDLWVPAGALRAVGTAAGMAGKHVGGDGLVVLTWQAPDGGGVLDTGLRLRPAGDRAALLQAAGALVQTSPGAGTTGAPLRETP